jgi:hypothetical protein
MAKYAATTDVPADRSRSEIEKTLARYGADQFAYGTTPEAAIVAFRMKDRRVKFVLPLPGQKHRNPEQETRTRWRCLLLCIKAKLESVESEIETFEDAFLAHIVLPSGQTVAETVRDNIRIAYESGTVPPLLPDFRGK